MSHGNGVFLRQNICWRRWLRSYLGLWLRYPSEQDNGCFLEAVLLKKNNSNPWWFAFTALTSVPEDFSLSGSDCSCGIFSLDVGKNGCKAEIKAENLKI